MARRLLAYESVAGETAVPTEAASLRVYEKLRRPLCALAGVAGFWSLASRALTLAKAEAPALSAVQITMDGDLQGLTELEPQIDKDRAEQGDADAQNKLAGAFLYGHGVRRDEAEAVRWWRKAADQGYAEARFSLGSAYY